MVGGEGSLGGFGKDVENAVLASFAAVVLLPVIPAFLRMQSVRAIKRDIGLESSGQGEMTA
ncbi:hypothetical protein GCM10020358_07720 [Amorphoplanes nipponensis]|uniref:Uncharacterized protein n=1 Tax=Actinoplanes nipponensis TaxID=135950 RepID=A0A919JFI6_9ACTN|nr:hypothetical protein [Actinoplanes nipponensis]GIE48072.1 hypothetical protein Ani05nite_16060 [Actinoplanes nipponensis]